MNRLLIARVAHAINLAYCASLGDLTQVVWEEAPEWQQQSALAGVDMHLANPDATPEQSHESWLAQKTAEGWAYGEVKDAAAKLHPCFRPYAELPQEQKAKDHLFRAVVHALKDIPDAEAAVAEALANALTNAAQAPVGPRTPDIEQLVVIVGHLPVQYIGRKPTFTDHLYGTGLTFEQGQVRGLPDDIARKFLRHADQFKEAKGLAVVADQDQAQSNEQDDTAKKLAEAKRLQEEEQKQQDQLHDLRQQIGNMTKESLCDYAQVNYRQKLDKRASVGELRQQVIGMVDQFGQV